jgi:hypothetical protein
VASKLEKLYFLTTCLVKAKLWKQWNKLKDRTIDNMSGKEKRGHAKGSKLIQDNIGMLGKNWYGGEKWRTVTRNKTTSRILHAF